MAGFVYYVPTTTQQKKVLAEAGFPFVADACLPGAGGTGPDGQTGSTFCLQKGVHADAREPKVGYYPEEQEWRDCGKWWLGWEKDGRPTAADLQLREAPIGHPVELGEHGAFVVPVVRNWDGNPGIPTKWGYDDERNVVRKIPEKHRELWEFVSRLYEATFRENGEVILISEALAGTTLALSLNYRLSVDEVFHLEMLGDDEFLACRDAMLDWERIKTEVAAMETKKKTGTVG